jgi:hypothetical protein
MKEKRLVLNEKQKLKLLHENPNCYICEKSLKGYNKNEIQYDHIYNYSDGYPQIISNFAPVHASRVKSKLNCHKEKGQKSPIAYKEELRIKEKLITINGLGDLCQSAVASNYKISRGNKEIEFNGKKLPLYNQIINGKDNYYFYDEVAIKFIENDNEIQLRPLGPNILPLIFNLKNAIQLFPSLGRLDNSTKTIKIFDGQHKAVAQIIGNNRDYIQCIIFVNAEIKSLQEVIYEAHSTFVQQKYNRNHIESKLASIYKNKIKAYRASIGDPQASFTEKDILIGETRAKKNQIILSATIEELKSLTNFINENVAPTKKDQKQKPMIWQSLEKMVTILCNVEPISQLSDSPDNYRIDEIKNASFLLEQIKIHSINNKWSPANPDTNPHRLSRTFFYKMAFNNWIKILEEALRNGLAIKTGINVVGALCYRKEFDTATKKQFEKIIKKLFEHPLWVKPKNQYDIAKANKEDAVLRIFNSEKLSWTYLIKV